MRFAAMAVLVGVLANNAAGSDLDSVRAVLEAKRQGLTVASPLQLDVAGYNFHWVVEPGPEKLVIAFSRSLGGALLSFDRDGSLVDSEATGEFGWLQVCDLDEDGIGELLAEETVGRGTGILTKVYRLYRLAGFRIGRVWEADSFSRKLAPEENGDRLVPQVIRSHIRCEPSGGGQEAARLLLLTETVRGAGAPVVARRAFSLLAGRVIEVPW